MAANDDFAGVYLLMSPATNLIKIGKSQRVRARLRSLMTGNPDERASAFAIPADNPDALEARLHAEYADRRRCGEWFVISDCEAMRIVQASPRGAVFLRRDQFNATSPLHAASASSESHELEARAIAVGMWTPVKHPAVFEAMALMARSYDLNLPRNAKRRPFCETEHALESKRVHLDRFVSALAAVSRIYHKALPCVSFIPDAIARIAYSGTGFVNAWSGLALTDDEYEASDEFQHWAHCLVGMAHKAGEDNSSYMQARRRLAAHPYDWNKAEMFATFRLSRWASELDDEIAAVIRSGQCEP